MSDQDVLCFVSSGFLCSVRFHDHHGRHREKIERRTINIVPSRVIYGMVERTANDGAVRRSSQFTSRRPEPMNAGACVVRGRSQVEKRRLLCISHAKSF